MLLFNSDKLRVIRELSKITIDRNRGCNSISVNIAKRLIHAIAHGLDKKDIQKALPDMGITQKDYDDFLKTNPAIKL